MQRLFYLLVLFFFTASQAQRVKTIVPPSVVIGNAFQIQYVITDPSNLLTLSTPALDSFKVVSGPNRYRGNSMVNGKSVPIENITYTVVPVSTGHLKIPALTASFKNSAEEKTKEVAILVLPQPKASFLSNSSYTDISLYLPSSKADMQKLIDENIFVRTEVDKKTCFVGEPVIASFVLYSRLQSTSQVDNAPSLYGFTVMDMLDINEAHPGVKTIDGKIFNTSVLRKLQLYPDQAGDLVIDQMQLQNQVEFNDPELPNRKISFDKTLLSDIITIRVKKLPSPKPDNYTGAVGKFKIKMELPADSIEAEQQGKLFLTVSGKGNFIQFSPPLVHWPKNFDVFDPDITEQLSRTSTPQEGSRTYVYHFTCDSEGLYRLPAVSFCFFNPQKAAYENISSDSLEIKIIPARHEKNASHENSFRKVTLAWLPVVLVVLVALLSWYFKTRQKRKLPLATKAKPEHPSLVQKMEELNTKDLSEKETCIGIQKVIALVFKQYPGLSGKQKQSFLDIRQDCELMAYSDMNTEGKKEELKQRMILLIKELENNHSAYL
jgi:hypothetical protein